VVSYFAQRPAGGSASGFQGTGSLILFAAGGATTSISPYNSEAFNYTYSGSMTVGGGVVYVNADAQMAPARRWVVPRWD